jgi:hypothetical protein
MAVPSALKKILLGLEETGTKLKGVTLGDIGGKAAGLAKDAYSTVREHPKAAALGAGAGLAGGYGAHAAMSHDDDDDERQEKLQRMLEYIDGRDE